MSSPRAARLRARSVRGDDFQSATPNRRPTCRYHCRTCEGHFTSLEAFDAHRRYFECVWPEDSGLVEISNCVCKIADDVPKVGVTLHEAESASRLREYRRLQEGRETAQTERKRLAA